MAIMVYLLKEYANEEIDVAKAMLMALIHDIVEIDAGDTYEVSETPEARFVRAMDNFQPLLLNNSNDGSDWREHEIGKKQVMKRHITNTRPGSNIIWECAKKIIEENVRNGNIKDD